MERGGYEGSKLEYLNFKLGYFYDGHRAIVDCWATINLLINEKGAFDELKAKVRCKETLICAENAAFEKKIYSNPESIVGLMAKILGSVANFSASLLQLFLRQNPTQGAKQKSHIFIEKPLIFII